MADLDRPLNPLQMRFVEEYIKDSSSISKAAARAGYSVQSSPEAGSRLLADPRVKKLVQDARDRAVQALGITQEKVLQELWKVAGANPGDIVTVDADGEAVLDHRGAGEVAVTTVNGNGKKIKSVTTKTIKPADKIAALEKVAKIMNLFPKEDKEVTVNLSLTELIEASMKEGTGRLKADVPDSETEAP